MDMLIVNWGIFAELSNDWFVIQEGDLINHCPFKYVLISFFLVVNTTFFNPFNMVTRFRR